MEISELFVPFYSAYFYPYDDVRQSCGAIDLTPKNMQNLLWTLCFRLKK